MACRIGDALAAEQFCKGSRACGDRGGFALAAGRHEFGRNRGSIEQAVDPIRSRAAGSKNGKFD